jgi:hypothetical protein
MDEVTPPDPVGRSFTDPGTTGTAFHVFVVKRTAQSDLGVPVTSGGMPGMMNRRRR